MAFLAPLVHGRTLHLDFRSKFIASPEDFDASTIEWVRRHILAITAPSVFYRFGDADLWWSVFGNGRHTVSGVLCKAARVSEDCISDVGSRRLYVYLGVVSRQPSSFVPAMSIAHFAPLYQFVRNRWNETTDAELQAAAPVAYAELDFPPLESAAASVDLNCAPDSVALWPLEDAAMVWQAAHSVPSASAVIGPAFIGELKRGVYGNVCSSDVLSRRQESIRSGRPSGSTHSARVEFPNIHLKSVPHVPAPDLGEARSEPLGAQNRSGLGSLFGDLVESVKRPFNRAKNASGVWERNWHKWEDQGRGDEVRVFATLPGLLKSFSPSESKEAIADFLDALLQRSTALKIEEVSITKILKFTASASTQEGSFRVVGVIETDRTQSGCALVFVGSGAVDREAVRASAQKALSLFLENRR
jgi:hypothetical protein